MQINVFLSSRSLLCLAVVVVVACFQSFSALCLFSVFFSLSPRILSILQSYRLLLLCCLCNLLSASLFRVSFLFVYIKFFLSSEYLPRRGGTFHRSDRCFCYLMSLLTPPAPRVATTPPLTYYVVRQRWKKYFAVIEISHVSSWLRARHKRNERNNYACNSL